MHKLYKSGKLVKQQYYAIQLKNHLDFLTKLKNSIAYMYTTEPYRKGQMAGCFTFCLYSDMLAENLVIWGQHTIVTMRISVGSNQNEKLGGPDSITIRYTK